MNNLKNNIFKEMKNAPIFFRHKYLSKILNEKKSI